MRKGHEIVGRRRRWGVCGAVLGVVGGIAAGLPAAAPAGDWGQWGHDASRDSATDARGPVWPRLAPGWPISCGLCSAGPVIAEVTAPGAEAPRQAVFTGSVFARMIYGFGADGEPLPGNWPADLGPDTFGGSVGFPAIVRAGAETRIYAASVGDGEEWGTVYGLGADGRPLPGRWVWKGAQGVQIFSYPTLVEDDRTGDLPGYALYFAHGASTPDGTLDALDWHGKEKPGWPVQIPDVPAFVFAGPAVGPDGSAYLASRASSGGEGHVVLRAFTPSGRPKPGWPVQPGGEGAMTYLSGPSVGDDGTVYIGVELGPPYYEGSSCAYAFGPDGRVRPGWPVEMDGSVLGTPAISADGTIYMATHRSFDDGRRVASVYALTPGGAVKPGWPLRFSHHTEGAVSEGAIVGLAVDADGNLFFGSRGIMRAYNPNAQPLGGWPVKIAGAAEASWPALADNGRLYFFVFPFLGYQRIYALETGPPPGAARRARRGHGTEIAVKHPVREYGPPRPLPSPPPGPAPTLLRSGAVPLDQAGQGQSPLD